MSMTEKLITLRKQKGMTQNELAELLDVSRQAVSRWEAGSSVPGIDNLRVLSGLYGVSIDYLLDDSAEEPTTSLAEKQPKQETQEKPEEGNRPRGIVIGIATILIVVVFFTVGYLIGFRNRDQQDAESVLPMTNMTVEEDNSKPKETFSFD